MFFSDAEMRYLCTVFPNDYSLGIIQSKLVFQYAELPSPAHWAVEAIIDAERFAFGHADLKGLASSRADGVVDAFEANILDRHNPVVVGGNFIGSAAVAKAAGSSSSRWDLFRKDWRRQRQHTTRAWLLSVRSASCR